MMNLQKKGHLQEEDRKLWGCARRTQPHEYPSSFLAGRFFSGLIDPNLNIRIHHLRFNYYRKLAFGGQYCPLNDSTDDCDRGFRDWTRFDRMPNPNLWENVSVLA